MTEAGETPQIFICYAHEDNDSTEPSKRWLDRLLKHLAPLELQGQVDIWSDKQIELGEDWHERIQATLQEVKVAILLVSPSFLASRYIRNSELPVLLKNAKEKGVVILPILLRQCFWKETIFMYPDPRNGPERLSLSTIQVPTTNPLNSLREDQQDEVLYQVTQRIYQIVQEGQQSGKKPDESASKEGIKQKVKDNQIVKGNYDMCRIHDFVQTVKGRVQNKNFEYHENRTSVHGFLENRSGNEYFIKGSTGFVDVNEFVDDGIQAATLLIPFTADYTRKAFIGIRNEYRTEKKMVQGTYNIRVFMDGNRWLVNKVGIIFSGDVDDPNHESNSLTIRALERDIIPTLENGV